MRRSITMRRQARRGTRLGRYWALLALLALAAEPAAASCQSLFCQQANRLHSRQREAEIRRSIEERPGDTQAIRELLRFLGGKVHRERLIAAYEQAYTWEAAGAGDVEARVAAERRRWSERLARLEADDPAAWCAHDRTLPGADERLAAMRGRLAAAPAAPELAACLARELAAQGRREEAVVLLRTFLDEHPEPPAYQALAELFGDDNARVGILLEEQAARRPDDPEAALTLLRHYLPYGRRNVQREAGLALALRMLAGPLSPADHHQVCDALRDRFPAEHRDCLWRLYERPPGEVPDYRGSALQALRFAAVRARDGDELEAVLARTPAEDHLAHWAHAVAFSRGELCPQFLAAAARGLAWEHEWQARQLAQTLEECGSDEPARRVLGAAGLLNPDGSRRPHQHTLESLRSGPFTAGGNSLPPREYVASLPQHAAAGLRQGLRQWTHERPEELAPWLYLAAFAERDGDADAAVASLQAGFASRPDDLDLQVALGAAALRLGRPEAVRAVARRLQRHRNAGTRHAAEAEYLLGRLARREGRWQEASDRLGAYFLSRLRRIGCRSAELCDRGLLLHLVEAGDGERLASYLEQRAAALDEYYAEPSQRLFVDQCGAGRGATCRTALEVDPAQLPVDCGSPRALVHFEDLARGTSDSENPDAARRLDELRARRPCDAEELPDPEQHFPDDELLALSWDLRALG